MIQFLVNSEKPRDAAMRNTGTGFVVLSHHSLFFNKTRNECLVGLTFYVEMRHIIKSVEKRQI